MAKKLAKKIEKVWVEVVYDDMYSPISGESEDVLAGLESGKFIPYGIIAKANVLVPLGDHWISHRVESGGLWGILLSAYESENEVYVSEIAEEEIDNLKAILRELGFSKQVVSSKALFKDYVVVYK